MKGGFPPAIAADIARARRLEYWTIGWLASIIAVMGLAMGGSQAMRTAWIEDLLSLVPAIVFLIAVRLEERAPTRRYPFGFARIHSLAFLVSSVALAGVGLFLLWDSAHTLLIGERVTVPPVVLFGHELWLGWLMIAALVYSVIPPLILGRMKLPLAQRLSDEVLHTDALMQKADWMTGLAGIGGVVGIGLGYWWADAAAAGIIAFSIVSDGVRTLRIAVAELADGQPRRLGTVEADPEAEALEAALHTRFPGASVRLRESGRYLQAEVSGAVPPARLDPAGCWPGDPARAWRLAQVAFVPPGDGDAAA